MGLLNFASWLKESIDGWLETVDNLDPSKKLRGTGIGAALNKLNPLHHLTKTHDGEKHQDLAPSARFEEVIVGARHRPAPAVGTVEVEVLCAGGWTTSGVGDALSAEDCYALVLLDGGVAQTNVIQDAKVPAWRATDRRAFRFRVADPGATLYVGIFDEDPNPIESDDAIGRCAIALSAFAPGARYDAWFPLTWKATEQEDLATKGRALVADQALATAATSPAGRNTQADSRGAIRLRVKVTWDDGGKALALSALTGLTKGTQYVVAPATKSGKALRENCRFTMYGEGACPHDAVNEPFSMAMVGDHAHELVDLILGLIGGVKNRVLSLVTYRKPFRSVLALVAWMTSVSNHARGIAWLWLLAGLELRDTLAGDTAPADLLQTPRKPSTKIAKPQLSFEAWAATLAVGASAVKPTTEEEADDARNHARGDAENVAVEKMLDEWRASGKVKAAEVEDEDGEADPDDFLSKKPMKKFGSMHPLAPFVRPIQRLLLQLLLPLRAIRGLLDGRDDPVATSTVALLCLVVSAGMFVYAQFLHHWVTWAVGWFVCVLSYVIGLALLGPQNYFLIRAYAKKRQNRHRVRALAGFDPNGYAALKIQDFYRNYKAHLLKLAEEAKKRVAEEKKRAKDEAAVAAKAEADAKLKAAEEKKIKDAIDKHDRAALDALHARQEDLDLGPIVATKHSSFPAIRTHEKVLKLEDDNITFTYACPDAHGGTFGSHEAKHVHLKNITQVDLVNATKPTVFRFRVGHKKYEFHCQSGDDCQLLVQGMRAAAARLAAKPEQMGKKGILRLAVPSKPFGLVNASTLERRPAFPEEFRSVVLGDDKKKPIARD